jgi:hypothetical protein
MRVVSARFPALALTILLSISTIATAQTKIGVTSGTSGDPLGKPPAEAERVLRVGVDVKANEAVTTGAADRAHLLFLDGSSLTVGPQAKLTIDKFIYDPATKKGDLAVHVGNGVFRFVGGRISKTHPVSIETPSASLTIRGGIMLIDVQPTKTVATFMFGVEMTVIANGVKQTVSRPGWQVTVLSGAAPGSPSSRRCVRNRTPAIPTRRCKARASRRRIQGAAHRLAQAVPTPAPSMTRITPLPAPTPKSRSRCSYPKQRRSPVAATSSELFACTLSESLVTGF